MDVNMSALIFHPPSGSQVARFRTYPAKMSAVPGSRWGSLSWFDWEAVWCERVRVTILASFGNSSVTPGSAWLIDYSYIHSITWGRSGYKFWGRRLVGRAVGRSSAGACWVGRVGLGASLSDVWVGLEGCGVDCGKAIWHRQTKPTI